MGADAGIPRYAEGTLLAWSLAGREAQLCAAAEIEPAHLLLGLCKLCDLDVAGVAAVAADAALARELEADVGMLRSCVEGAGIDPAPFRRWLRARVARSGAEHADEDELHRSVETRRVFARAEGHAAESLDDRLRPVHLLTALLELRDPRWAEGVSRVPAAEPADPPGGEGGAQFLDRFGRDLTRLAREGKLEPLIGRRGETRALARALIQQRKRSAILVGEAGVGKTGIVEGLAQRLVGDDPPRELSGVRIVGVQMADLLAGAKYRGEFEGRMQRLVEEAGRDDRVILFIDEIHTLLGAGGEGASDAANILKPALARGELRVIGATTTAEYRRHVERDPALERRFAAVWVEEPSEDEAVEILTGLRPRLEAHHEIAISDEAIAAAVELSLRHLPDRRLPDKAIDLIDEACAAERLATLTPRARAPAATAIGRADVAAVVARRCRIPVERLTREEGERLLGLEAALSARVVGQPDAVHAVCAAIRTARAGLGDPRRPVAVLLFAGPTGTGKTELAKALCEALFDDERHLVRIDLSEYQERHSVSRLIGPPPGYVGYDEREGELTGPVRTRPYSVVLLDEIEKAHPDVLDVCLQIFDDGHLTDTRGRRVSFRDTVIILTSNLGSGRAYQVGFPRSEGDGRRERVEAAITEALKPELLNRIQRVVVFDPLDESAIGQIVDKLLARLRTQLRDRHAIELDLTESAYALLVHEGFDERWGARELERAVAHLLAEPLAEAVVAGRLPGGAHVRVHGGDGELAFVAGPAEDRAHRPSGTSS